MTIDDILFGTLASLKVCNHLGLHAELVADHILRKRGVFLKKLYR